MGRPKVLIIDDEAEFSTTLAERLALRDYEAIAPTSLSQVRSLIAEELPDVLLLDLRMPGLNGLELLRETKRTDPGIEIIVVTGLTDPSVVSAALGAGASDFMTKPVDISKLIEKIDEVTSRQRDRQTNNGD
jgi:DNA-binding response OmpR family regulator